MGKKKGSWMKIVGRGARRQGDHVGPPVHSSSAGVRGASVLGELADQDRPGASQSIIVLGAHTSHMTYIRFVLL